MPPEPDAVHRDPSLLDPNPGGPNPGGPNPGGPNPGGPNPGGPNPGGPNPGGPNPGGPTPGGPNPGGLGLLDPSLLAAKEALRTVMIARRRGHDAAACGEAVAGHMLRDCPPPPGAV